MEKIVDWTNSQINNPDKRMTTLELKKYLGVMLAMCVDPCSKLKQYWFDINEGKCSRKFGERFTMTYSRFDFLKSHLRFSDPAEEANILDDPACVVYWLINQFNENAERIFEPGDSLCCDESTSRHRGRSFEKSHQGAPSKATGQKKPEVGSCLRTLSDASTGALIRLELQQNDELTRRKKFFDQYPKIPALVLRLSEPWHGTKRCVCADGLFGSVATAEALYEHGLYFTGVIKKGTKHYPKKWLDRFAFGENDARGAFKTLHSRIANDQAVCLAHAWNEPDYNVRKKRSRKRTKKSGILGPKLFVSARGSFRESTSPMIKKRIIKGRLSNGKVYLGRQSFTVPIAKEVQHYFSVADSIDNHNELRQGEVKMEKISVTKRWDYRVFQTVLSMCATNAFLTYYDGEDKKPEISNFILDLAKQLTVEPESNEFFNLQTRLQKSRRSEMEDDQSTAPNKPHICVSLLAHPVTNPSGASTQRVRCRHLLENGKKCSQPTRTYCSKCSITSGPNFQLFGLCGPNTRGRCAVHHAQQAAAQEAIWNPDESSDDAGLSA